MKGIYRYIIPALVIPLFMISSQAFAQFYEAKITKVVDESGNTPSATFDIVEDSQGFIWFGTVDGLHRYDGYNFKTFRHHESDSTSLSNNTIRDMAVSIDQKLWIATSGGGMNCLNLVTEEITRYVHTGIRENELSGNDVWSVMIDSKGYIWAGISEKGLDRLDPETNTFEHYRLFPEDSLSYFYSGSIRSLFEDSKGDIWTGVGNTNLCILNPTTKAVKHYYFPTKIPDGPSNCTVFDIFEDNDNNIWLCTYGGGINIYYRETGKFKEIRNQKRNANSLLSDYTYSIMEKDKGQFWMATESGLSVLDTVNHKYTQYIKETTNTNSINENRLRCVFVDSKGIVWIGSESGVDKLVEQKRFKLYKHFPGKKNSLKEGIVRSIYEDSHNNLWIGLVDRGLMRYHKPTQTYYSYFEHPVIESGIEGNLIASIFEDSQGNLWVGEWDSGLYRYNRKSDSFKLVVSRTSENNPISSDQIQVIDEAKPGYLWLGTEYGLNLYHIETREVLHYFHDPTNSNSISNNGIQSQAFVVDEKGNVWLGTWAGGLNYIEFENGDFTKPVFKIWKNHPNDPESLGNNNVISLLLDDQVLWVGTFGGGIYKFDLQLQKFTNYNSDDGLPNNIIFSIVKDHMNNLWLSTDKGISRFNPETEQFLNFDENDGLQDDHFFWGAAHQNDEGEIFFGGINGMNSFNPVDVIPNIYDPTPVMLSILAYNQPVEAEKAISKLFALELPHNENFITFEFSALDYFEPQKTQFQYFLEGLDKEWHWNGNRRFATYTNLAPGKYDFKLKVTNSDGIWSQKILNFSLNILPPWWKTWWARLLFFLSVLFVVFGFYFIRIGILKSQKKKLEEQVKLRTSEIEQKNEELKQTLEQLELAQKALVESEKMASLGILSAGVAHEINNPLNFITGSISNIKSLIEESKKEGYTLDDAKKELIDRLISHSETGVERITSITRSLRTYAHKGDGTMQPTDLEELIHSVLTIIHSKIPHYVTIHNDFHAVPEIQCKQDQISQVLLNIIDNAIQAIESKENRGEEVIRIQTDLLDHKGKEHVRISISNTGPLLSDDTIKHIFDPFFTTKSPNKGSGLGLYISYGIINDHNGLIRVENKKNSVNFEVLLPV